MSFNETNPSKEDKLFTVDDDDDFDEVPSEVNTNDNHVEQTRKQDGGLQQEQNNNNLPQEWRTYRNHPIDNIIGKISKGVSTCHNFKDACINMKFVSKTEPSKIKDTLDDDQ